jgi:CheY-like chemotaxis protein
VKKREILVADDELVAQNMVRTALTQAGYSVVAAANGMDAIKLAVERHPDLIVLDIMMPDLDGGEVAEILHKDPKTADIPIIFLSALISEEDERGTGKKDVASFMSKPYHRDRLLNEVRKCLNRESS